MRHMNLDSIHVARDLKYMHDALNTIRKFRKYSHIDNASRTIANARARFYHYWKNARTLNPILP